MDSLVHQLQEFAAKADLAARSKLLEDMRKLQQSLITTEWNLLVGMISGVSPCAPTLYMRTDRGLLNSCPAYANGRVQSGRRPPCVRDARQQ